MSLSSRVAMLAIVSLVLLAGVLAAGPVAQPLGYHQFADGRTLFGVPNFLNVASNILFLLVGVAGVALWLRQPGMKYSWLVLFLGTALVAAGSAYYHWAPDNATLVWDRLPMTIALMGLFVAMLSEHIDEKLEGVLLVPALVVGMASVGWWSYTDDLRFYLWVQLLPLVTIALVVALFPGRFSHRRFLLYGLGFYALAKAAEFWDREFLAVTGGMLSGHSLKHLLAGIALLCVYLMLRWRKPLPSAGRMASHSAAPVEHL